MTPADIGFVTLLNVEALFALLVALNPVNDRNMHRRFAGPHHA